MNINKKIIVSLGLFLLLTITAVSAAEIPTKDISNKQESNIKKDPQPTPGFMGQVTNISGSIITIKTTKNDIFTVETTDAVITKKGNALITFSQISVGDDIFAQGVLTGKTIKATRIIDGISEASLQNQATAAAQEHAQNQDNKDQPEQQKLGFFARIGKFFRGIFGKK